MLHLQRRAINCAYGKNRSVSVVSGKRPLIIIGMLLASLLLMGVLGWQSWRLQQSNDVAAESVLREYGTLVADEYGRRITSELGYRGYYQLIAKIGELPDAVAMKAALSQFPELTELASGFFVLDERGLQTDSIPQTPALAELLRSIYAQLAGGDGPFHSLTTDPGGVQLIYATGPAPSGGKRIYGFAVAHSGIAYYMQRAFDSGPLLPPSLAGGRVGNELLFLEVTNPAGDILFETNRQFDSNLTISKLLGDDYQGILDGYQVRVSVDPDSAAILLIGGLPESRLPLLFAVMIIMMIMTSSAIWLFRREQAVMHMRSDFVSQVSHELRTPLTQIRMFAETLLLDRARTNEESRRCLEIIDRESRRLSHLVENVLRFSKISDTTRVDRHSQLLEPIVRDVCETMEANANGATIAVASADERVEANIDADAVHQILMNIIDNAIKFGPKEQQVMVSLSRKGESARISVEDQGPGIPEGERDNVWNAYYRLKRESDTAISGTGIGLSVVRELVEAMEGRYWIDAPNGGTRINIDFQT